MQPPRISDSFENITLLFYHLVKFFKNTCLLYYTQIRAFRFNIDFIAKEHYAYKDNLYTSVQYKTGYCYMTLFCLHSQTLFMIISLVCRLSKGKERVGVNMIQGWVKMDPALILT